MFQQLKPVTHRSSITKKMKDETDMNELLDTLFGKYDDGESDYVIYRYDNGSEWGLSRKTTLLQRFNMIWVWPLFMITVPFQWLFLGKVGINGHSKFGKWILKITGVE